MNAEPSHYLVWPLVKGAVAECGGSLTMIEMWDTDQHNQPVSYVCNYVINGQELIGTVLVGPNDTLPSHERIVAQIQEQLKS